MPFHIKWALLLARCHCSAHFTTCAESCYKSNGIQLMGSHSSQIKSKCLYIHAACVIFLDQVGND